MSLTGTLSNALSGLTAASRAVEVVSSNVANAMTEGYAKREINLASHTVGGSGSGVRVVGVSRLVNERVLSDQRDATANMSNASAHADAWLRIEQAIGYPTEDGSLTDRIDDFEAALITAASRPDDDVRLGNAVASAVSVVDAIQSLETEIQTMRMDADADIASMVETLNDQLKQVEALNWQIFRMGNSDQDTLPLMDHRQQLVDSIAEVIPVRQVERAGNQIALYAPGGAALIDGPAAELGFDPTRTITPAMTIEGGTLSGLTLNDQPLSLGSTYGSIEGGRLSAAFDVRDEVTIEAQTAIDAIARDLIERFQDADFLSTDSTTGLGLFVDGSGILFDASGDVIADNEVGISGRIQVNSEVDSSRGGDARQLRDGFGSLTAGDVGNASLLTALADRVSEVRNVESGPSKDLPRSLSALASDFLSDVNANYRNRESTQAFQAARVDALSYELSEDGVDTDDEMQKLLLIEQVYSANAQVVRTVDELMQQILEL